MPNKPNVVLRGGPGDGQISYFPALGDPMPFEDVGGGLIIYVDNDEPRSTRASSCGSMCRKSDHPESCLAHSAAWAPSLNAPLSATGATVAEWLP